MAGRANGGGSAFGFFGSGRGAGERTRETAEGLRDTAAAARDQADAMASRWTDSATAARDQAADTAGRWTDSARDAANDWADQTRSAASRFGDRAGEAGARLQETGQAAASAVNQAASAAYDTAARTSRQGADIFGRTASRLSENASSGGRAVAEFFQEQPLLLAGIGLALGALLGASLPGTGTEDRLMGETSDATKAEAKEVAEQQLDKGKAASQEAWNALSREVEQQLNEQRGDEGHGEAANAGSGEAGREAPLVPSDQSESAGMQAASHDAAGDRKHSVE